MITKWLYKYIRVAEDKESGKVPPSYQQIQMEETQIHYFDFAPMLSKWD